MNLLLHGIGAEDADSPITVDDALKADPGERFDMVLTNPPFGRKSSMTIVNAEGETEREDLVDRARRLLGVDLEQAAQLPPARQDAAEDQRPSRGRRARQRAVRGRRGRDGAAQAARTSATCTRCCGCRPAIFYAQGVKANVLFFDRKPAAETPWTQDAVGLRLAHQQHFTLKQNPLRYERPRRLRRRRYRADDRSQRVESRAVPAASRYDELIAARQGRASTSSGCATSRSRTPSNLPPPEVHRRGDRRGPRGGARRVRADRREPARRADLDGEAPTNRPSAGADDRVRRSPGCANACVEQSNPCGRLVCVRPLLTDALDRREPGSALCPVCSAICRPYSSADFREP